MATLGRLKRGSVQIQRAAIKATGRIGARTIMTALVVWALVLQGLVQHSPSVVLLALSNPLSSEEFAEYVANTSYVTRYCRPGNGSEGVVLDDAAPPPPLGYEGQGEQEASAALSFAANDSELLPAFWNDSAASFVNVLRNGSAAAPRPRHSLAEPDLKVPLSEQDSAEALLREAFLWGSLASPLPAARLVARVGAARVAGCAGLGAGALTALQPFAWDTPYHFFLRLAQGFFSGAIWPAFHTLGTRWYPPLQRTGYVSFYATVALGQAGAGLLGAPLVRLAGREWVSYVLTCLTVLWFLAWLRLVRDTPAAHPRVSDEQRLRLQAAIGAAVSAPAEVAPLPWRHMLLSVPVWACAVANLGSQWGQATLQLAVTKYLKLVYGFALTYDRVLSVLPPVGHCMAALLFGQLADHARSTALVSTTTARRLLVYTSHFPAGAILFVVGYSGCDPAAPAALYTAAVVISGAAAAGVHASAMDLAPNYAGTVFGLSQTLGAAGGLAGSYVVTEALHGSLPGSWRLVFGVAALVLGLTAMAFLGYGSGSVQPWNGGAPAAAAGTAGAEDLPLPVVEVTPPEDEGDPEAGTSTGGYPGHLTPPTPHATLPHGDDAAAAASTAIAAPAADEAESSTLPQSGTVAGQEFSEEVSPQQSRDPTNRDASHKATSPKEETAVEETSCASQGRPGVSEGDTSHIVSAPSEQEQPSRPTNQSVPGD